MYICICIYIYDISTVNHIKSCQNVSPHSKARWCRSSARAWQYGDDRSDLGRKLVKTSQFHRPKWMLQPKHFNAVGCVGNIYRKPCVFPMGCFQRDKYFKPCFHTATVDKQSVCWFPYSIQYISILYIGSIYKFLFEYVHIVHV